MKSIGTHPAHRRPFTGAWIETFVCDLATVPNACRPFTGAWIETSFSCADFSFFLRRPFTGAWIETILQSVIRSITTSPLHRGVD